jgi:outer membrane lipoprotein-sorting protein
MKLTDKRSVCIGMLLLVLAACGAAAAEKDGNAVIAEMDKRMNFTECRMVIRIEDAKADGKKRTLKARVDYLKDVGTRMDFEEPVRDKGKCVLMSGTSMWMSSPSVSKPVRLSGKDAFMGTSFTNDDVMNLDKGDDYDSVIGSSGPDGWEIVMTAKSASLPYPKITAKIGKDFLPVSMVYFARSGKESKRVDFSAVKNFGGRDKPSVMAIVDLMKPGDASSVIFEEIREESVSRARLTPASLGN